MSIVDGGQRRLLALAASRNQQGFVRVPKVNGREPQIKNQQSKLKNDIDASFRKPNKKATHVRFT